MKIISRGIAVMCYLVFLMLRSLKWVSLASRVK